MISILVYRHRLLSHFSHLTFAAFLLSAKSCQWFGYGISPLLYLICCICWNQNGANCWRVEFLGSLFPAASLLHAWHKKWCTLAEGTTSGHVLPLFSLQLHFCLAKNEASCCRIKLLGGLLPAAMLLATLWHKSSALLWGVWLLAFTVNCLLCTLPSCAKIMEPATTAKLFGEE